MDVDDSWHIEFCWSYVDLLTMLKYGVFIVYLLVLYMLVCKDKLIWLTTCTCIHITFVFSGKLKRFDLYGVLLMS